MKSKNLKVRIILIASIISVIAIVIALLFFFTDIFRTKKGAFFRYLKMTESGLDILNITEFNDYNELKETMPYIRNGEMIVKTSSNIADSSIMDKLKLNLQGKVNTPQEKANYQISVSSSNRELFNINLAQDKNVYAFFSPQISTKYIGIKNENLQEISNAIFENIYVPNEIMKIKVDTLLEVSNVQRKHIDEYYNMLKNITSDAEYNKENKKVQIDDKNYNTTQYTLSLKEKDSADTQIQLLSKLTQDSIMMDFITSRFKLLNLSEEYTDINTLNVKMLNKIENLRLHPENAEEIEISVNEYKQKNLITTIKVNENIVSIMHLEEDGEEKLILGFNDKFFKISKLDNKYTFKYSYVEDEIDKSIEIVYNMDGTIEDNNIQNIMEITTTNGIKKVTYSYKDNISFTNDIGMIETFNENDIAILNNYSKDEVKSFMKSLKEIINYVYVNTGANIGINLDPIFKDVE